MTTTGFNHWPEIAAQLKPGAQKVVTNTASGIQGLASGNAPRKTGFMAGAVYRVTPLEGSTYGSGGSPPGDAYLLEEQTPPDDTSAIVGAAANYSEWVELGHHVHNSTAYVPANPWFFPAVEAGQGIFDDELQAFADSLGIR